MTSAGDIDNRLKTHLDSLRVPGVPQEIASSTRPSSSKEPNSTLLDDALITRINIETDRLLAAPDPSQVRLIIRVDPTPVQGGATLNTSRLIIARPPKLDETGISCGRPTTVPAVHIAPAKI